MNILSPDDLSSITTATRQTYGETIQRPQVYRIGRKRADGTRQIRAGIGRIWVRPYTGDDNQHQAIPAKYPSDWDPADIIFNSFVEVLAYGGGLRVSGYAPENAEFLGDTVVRPQRLMDPSQLNLNLILPTDPASMHVQVTPAQYIVDGRVYAAPLRLTADLRSYAPVDPEQAVGVLVEYDPLQAVFLYTPSAPFLNMPLHDALLAGLLPVELTHFCCGWVKVRAGQTIIAREDIQPEQHILSRGGGLVGCVKTVIDRETLLPADHQCLLADGLEIAEGGSLDVLGELFILDLSSIS